MRWIWYTLAVLWLLDALRLRRRLAALPVLSPATTAPSREYLFVTSPGVTLDRATQASASQHAAAGGLDLVDLLPQDTPTLLAIQVAQCIEPRVYRHDRIARGHASGFALLVNRDTLARAGVTPPAVCDAAQLARLAYTVRPFARAADIVVAPGLASTVDTLTDDWTVLLETAGTGARSIFMARALALGAMLVGLGLAPEAALASIAAFHLQVAIIFGGLALKPRDLALTLLFRLPLEIWKWGRTLVSRMHMGHPQIAAVEGRRAHYTALMAGGVESFFEPRREQCPACDSRDIAPRLRMRDLYQHKPGTFTLDACRACGHIFQNPQLSPTGLQFYYGDFYDGLGGQVLESIFRSQRPLYTRRAEAIRGVSTPRRWLDVGTGHGHFCCVARETWPETQFDGLDIGDSVETAERTGWIAQGYRGFFPQLAPDLAGRYDVVSLFHCLEHTPDPRAEIVAARTVLEQDGLLVIEVPDPECPLGSILGRLWLPWFQPQHLHLFSVRNLEKLLKQEGFEPVRVQRAEARVPRADLLMPVVLFFYWLGPKVHVPWRPRPSWASRLRYALVSNVGMPFILIAWVLDSLLDPLLRAVGPSNTYRLVARRVT